jgi:DNA-binding CsgD family transcriptional regulator
VSNPWNLTAREAQILCMLAAASDCNSKRAARALGLSHRTVETYVQRACGKMGVPTRMAAVLKWDREHRACSHCMVRRLEAAA